MNFEKKYKWCMARKYMFIVAAIVFFLFFIMHFFETILNCSNPQTNYDIALVASIMVGFYIFNINMFMQEISHEYSMATLEGREVSFELKRKYIYMHKNPSYGILIILFFITLILFAIYNFKAFFIDHTVKFAMAVLYCVGVAVYSSLILRLVKKSSYHHHQIIEGRSMYHRYMASLKKRNLNKVENSNV